LIVPLNGTFRTGNRQGYRPASRDVKPRRDLAASRRTFRPFGVSSTLAVTAGKEEWI
jgi:hypothetical protein